MVKLKRCKENPRPLTKLLPKQAHIKSCCISVCVHPHTTLAAVCNPKLQVIGLQIPCMEIVGVAVDALKLFLRLKF